jgi:hypothetical protein
MNAPIKSGEVSLAANTLLFLRVTTDALAIVSTSGCLTVTCSAPSLALRDVLAGKNAEFLRGSSYGRTPLNYTVTATDFHMRQGRPDGTVMADNVPVRRGWFVLETGQAKDYHPWESLQIVGLARSQCIVIGFASATYEASFAAGIDLSLQFRQIADASKCCHCTVLSANGYLDWVPARRSHCVRIREILDIPNMGALLEIKDFSAEPDHRAFKARMPQRPRGHDLSL